MISFDDYEKILIGIGGSFNHDFDKELSLSEQYKSVVNNKKVEILKAYNKLADLLDGKDYYVVSTCNDDCIYESNIDKNRVVTPCGGYRFIQCEDDCAHELLAFSENMLDEIDNMLCPHCGKKVVFNRMPLEHYNEGGYLDAWEQYQKWLQSTINKKLLILELGVGMEYPTVIRFAFEKLAYYNNKAKMIRVHEKLAFSTPELQDKCICEKMGAVEFLNNM